MATDPTKVRGFNGLNNIADPITLGLEWLTTADNINVLRSRRTKIRPGRAAASISAAFTSGYSTLDFTRMYLQSGSTLKRVLGDMATDTLRTGLSTAAMSWTEFNEQVFYTNGTDSGIIARNESLMDWSWPVPAAVALLPIAGTLPAGQYQVTCTYLLADGRETGSGDVAEIVLETDQAIQISAIPQVTGLRTLVYIAPANSSVFAFAFASVSTVATWNFGPDNLGADLRTHLKRPLPAGAEVICAWNGRLCAAQYLPGQDQSVIWFSDPLAPHLFDQVKGFVMVLGKVVMLADADSALVIGTDSAVYSWAGSELATLAQYGVIPGYSAATDKDKSVTFWTARGACRAMPFQNITEDRISVAPGVRAGAAIVEAGGETRYVVALQAGGTAFNSRS